MKTYYLILGLFLSGFFLQGCFDDDSETGGNILVPVEIRAERDTINANFGEEVIIDFVQVDQDGASLPLTYEWGWASLAYSNGVLKPYPLKDSLKIVSNDLQLKYAFRKLGTFGLRLKVDNGESIQFKYFILNVNSGLDEGLTLLSRDETGKGRISFLKTPVAGEPEPEFMTDILDFTNPDLVMQGVTDMIQHKGWLLVSSEQEGRIYNMDSRTFQVQTMTSFTPDFSDFAGRKFTGISAQNYMYLFSADHQAYVYECENNVLLKTEYFEGLHIDQGYLCNKPFFIDYANSELYSPKSAGLNRSNQKFADYDILQLTHVASTVYVIATYKDDPLHVYIASTTASFGTPKKVQDYTADGPLNIDRNSLVVSSKTYKDIYYTFGTSVYRWVTSRKLPADAFISFSSTEQITALDIDEEGKLLYIGVYDPALPSALKGSLYIYDADTGDLLHSYKGIADIPLRVLYKERV